MTERAQIVRTVAAGFIALLAMVCAAPVPITYAADEDAAQSFLNPFPEGEIYQVAVIGDTFAGGVLDGLVEAFGADTRLTVQKPIKEIYGLMSGDFEAKAKALEEALNSGNFNIAVVMVGEDDRVSWKKPDGKRAPIVSPEWTAEYSRRMDRIMKIVRRKNAGVYWIGLPNLARPDADEQAKAMNDVIRERAYLNGMKFIDAYAGFLDENGAYSAYGPDLSGKIRVLRQADGVHFTAAGNRNLAHFVEKELRRDLNQAKANRAVPLLGAEAEQAKVNPDNAVKTPAPSSPVAQPGMSAAPAAPLIKATRIDGTPPSATADPSGDQKADNGKVTLKVTGANGREETASVEIVRPAIPASVVALMARRESTGQFGDLIVDQLAGGLTLMSSITPSGTKSRGKIAPTQAPYFRVLVKGERPSPKPGRADDASWPLAGSTSEAPAAPAAPGAAPNPAPKG